jgi:UDPglucose 6-dehydrogenase
MRIAVLGTGYVGLVAGTCLAESGNDVVCVDIDAEKVARLTRGEIPIYEPGLEDLVQANIDAGRLSFSTTVGSVADRDVIFVAVGTPADEDGSADLAYVLDAARALADHAGDEALVVLKSTVPVGTADKVRAVLEEARGAQAPEVVSNPEFMKEGAALEDFLKPDRVVIGARSERARRIMGDLYAPFVRTENPILFMDNRSAELTKYAANALLATRISFMNDIALLCDEVGADVDLVRKGVGSDKRIGYPFLFPGIGFGGSCFPKDIRALHFTAKQHHVDLGLVAAAERTNARMKRVLLDKALRHFEALSGRTFALWGLAFKPRTDDVREAPALTIIRGLVEAGARVRATDPAALKTAETALADLDHGGALTFHEDNYETLEGAEALFLTTEWNAFRRPDFSRMKDLMETPILFDGRNIWDPARMRELGFVYHGIGRK